MHTKAWVLKTDPPVFHLELLGRAALLSLAPAAAYGSCPGPGWGTLGTHSPCEGSAGPGRLLRSRLSSGWGCGTWPSAAVQGGRIFQLSSLPGPHGTLDTGFLTFLKCN